MAHVAVPENECSVGLDHSECVFAFAGLSHVELGYVSYVGACKL